MEKVRIQKLVHGGQGIGELADGRKVFVWNALPGELVNVRLRKKRRDYAEGVAEEIIEPAKERIEPADEAYLSTSPWQIMPFDSENKYKKQILAETFEREKVALPNFEFIAHGHELQYRNKMEYSFWADDSGLHLALFHRASHGKRIVHGSSIARPEIDKAVHHILEILNKNGVRGSQLKTVVLRTNKTGEVVAALFVKDDEFPETAELKYACKGLAVYYSTPKSPASVITRKLHQFGDITLTDRILGTDIMYDVNSFFQVNLPVFELALNEMKNHVSGKKLVDLYAGVGTIGISLGADVLVELDGHNIDMARQNSTKGNTKVVQSSTEKALDHITSDATIIFDPPRAGLHSKVVGRLLEVKPPRIIYLSCNPSTQARDVERLQNLYKITSFTGYNFFPRTPHIESLVILELR